MAWYLAKHRDKFTFILTASICKSLLDKISIHTMDGNYLQLRALEQNRQEEIMVRIQSRKWKCVGRTLKRKRISIERDRLDSNPQGSRRRKQERGREQFRRAL
jgi:hypothetical protein